MKKNVIVILSLFAVIMVLPFITSDVTAYSPIQTVTATATANAETVQASITVASGDQLIAVGLLTQGTTYQVLTMTCSDSLANTWITQYIIGAASGGSGVGVCTSTMQHATGSDTVTLTFTSQGSGDGEGNPSIVIYEVDSSFSLGSPVSENSCTDTQCESFSTVSGTSNIAVFSGVADGDSSGSHSQTCTCVIDYQNPAMSNYFGIGHNNGTWIVSATYIYFSGLSVSFSFTPPTTLVAWNVPSGGSMARVMEFLLSTVLVASLFLLIPIKAKNPDSYILFLLLGLTFGSVIGTLANFSPYSLIFVFGGFLAIYIWRGRSAGKVQVPTT
jgi:hypothetical protein